MMTKGNAVRPSANRIALLALLATAWSTPAAAVDSLDLNLEELMSVVVTSAAKKSQTLADTAAAVHVISAEDIRRSGATNIPEALRLAPGVQVSAIGNNKWAVSIRGFADRFANKLLVLVDGRSVYTPLFSGVMWETLGLPLENVARIEVIRGPGASIWGANAVNGVINIITRSPFDVQGSQIAAAAGSELKGHGFVRHGWSPDPDTAVAVHAKLHDVDASRRLGGGAGADDWQQFDAGFKMERLLEKGRLQVQGGAARSLAGDDVVMMTEPPAIYLERRTQRVSNGHLMGRWEGGSGTERQDSLQVYLESSDYKHAILAEQRTTADLEYQQQVKLGAAHDLTWGLGYRFSSDRIESSPLIRVAERRRATSLYSLFAQDEITLQPERWRLSVGARLEHNDYTGFVIQPNLRLLWTPSTQTSAWASLARAVRTPSRIERGGAAYLRAYPLGDPLFIQPSVVKLVSERIGDEQLDALDFGWRHQLNRSTSIDLVAFYYRYDRLRGAALTAPQPMPTGYLLIETLDNNANRARQHGIEASLDWRATADWRLQAHYGWLKTKVITADLPLQTVSDYTDTSPVHQFSLRSSLDLGSSWRWDAWLRHVSRIDNPVFGTIPAFTTLDMRLAWQARKGLELSLVGQNLLDRVHPEYGSNFIQSSPAEIQRAVYLRADWKY
jgi:iron complex outermembrane receptor protein